MTPVVDVTGLGMVEPEYSSKRTIFEEHDMSVQLLSCNMSYMASVSKELNVNVMIAAGYDIIADMNSELL
jgi:hypothetical protein